jgi:tRNA U55 pseudouridine synthase TruB
MQSIIWTYKPIGYSPTDCIHELKKLKEFEGHKLTFAGRLDPMASGLLPLLRGCDEGMKEELIGGYKVYQFSIICGLQTDTYDILGLSDIRKTSQNITIRDLMHKKEQSYPPYSSKSIYSDHYKKNVPLWKLCKEGLLDINRLPKHDIDIKYFNHIDSYDTDNTTLLQIIKKRIDTLPDTANFRQKEIMDQWTIVLSDPTQYTVQRYEAQVSTGTYIRGLADELNGVALDINRIGMHGMVIDGSVDKFNFFMI